MGTLKGRILAGMGANAFGQAISILTQLAALPLYLTWWTASQYGTWLMLSAIPSYFSMTDAGIINAARNEMTMALGRNDVVHANRVFQSALIFLLAISATVLSLFAAVLYLVPMSGFLQPDYALVLLLLVSGVFLAFFNGLSEACFCAVGLYGLGTMMGHTIRFAEWAGGLLGLIYFGSFTGVAGGMLCARAVGVAISIVLAGQFAPVLKWGFGEASVEQFKATARPAMYFLLLPLANALSLQGFTLLIGSVLGAASVAVFNTYRTLARVIAQSTSILSYSVGPELSRMFGAGHHEHYISLFRRTQLINLALVFGVSLFVAATGSWILALWTRGRIVYAPEVLWSMLGYATVVGISHVPKVLLMSINRHGAIATTSVLVYAVSLAIAWSFGASAGLVGTILIMAGGEAILMLLSVLWAESELRRSSAMLVPAL